MHRRCAGRDRRTPGRRQGLQRASWCAASHFGLIPLMVARSLLVLTTGRQFCSRYIDALPVRIVRCPVDLSAADLLPALARPDPCQAPPCAGCASRCATWPAAAHGTLPARRTAMKAIRADLLDFTGTPAGADRAMPPCALAARPLAADRRRRPHRRCSPTAPGPGLAARSTTRPAADARLHRHPCAQPAAGRDRQLRHRAARLAEHLHLPGRARHADPAVAAAGGRAFWTRCWPTARRRRWSSPRCTRPVDALFAAPASAACAGRRQGADGPPRARRAARRRGGCRGRLRMHRPDPALARPGPLPTR
jgi:hypothetical protein